MDQSEAVERLESLKDRAGRLIDLNTRSPEFKKWHRDTQVAIQYIFGEETRHLKDFTDIDYSPGRVYPRTSNPNIRISNSIFQSAYRNGIETAIKILDSLIDEIKYYWKQEQESHEQEPAALTKVKLLINRFHKVTRQLRFRYASREAIEIGDEHDVQYLFHSLLCIYFDDIRAEECTPSCAGAASRVDFLLKEEKIVIEVKKTRKGLSTKEIGEQLIIDSQRYQSHPNCDTLVCFVYDPEGRVSNPRGLEDDLTQDLNGVQIIVFVTPDS